MLADTLAARSVSETAPPQPLDDLEKAVPTKLGTGTTLHPNCPQDLRRRRRAARAINKARSRMRKGGRYRRAFVGRTYQTGGKEPGMHMIAWRFVQIAIEGSVQMGRAEEIADRKRTRLKPRQ